MAQSEPLRLLFRRTGKGAGVTAVERLQMHPAGKEELLTKFKKQFGVGGALKFGVLELQGDCRNKVEAALTDLGYKVRRIGD